MKLAIVLVCLVGAAEVCKALHDSAGGAPARRPGRPVFGRCKDSQISVMLREMAEDPPITITAISSSTQQGDCREVHRVELAINNSSDVISGIAVLALSSGDPVGKFSVPQESSGRPLASHQDCQTGHCVEPDDVIICLGMSQPQWSIHFEWLAPCDLQLKNVSFQYITASAQKGEEVVSKQQHHPNRLRRQVTSVSSTPYLVVANVHYIREITLDGQSFNPIVRGQGIRSLSYHYKANHLYWGDVGRGAIMRSSLDGSNPETIVDTDIIKPEDLAVDWVANKLYWVQSANSYIQVLDLSSGARQRELIDTGPGSKPWSLVVDPSTGWLYWTDWGDIARIQRASMDGQTIETVHNQSTSVRRPQALTIDYDSQTLYWSDDSLNIILSSQVEPGSEIKNISSYNFSISSMVIFGSSLYITDDYGVQSHILNRTGYQYIYDRYSSRDTCKSLYGIDVISEQIQGQSGLSVDWLSNKLYISRCDHLEVIDLINGYRKELISSATCDFRLNSIVVDPTNRFLYWISCDIYNGTYNYEVHKASMDANDITELYNINQFVYELDLDHSAQVLYWRTSSEIWSVSVDGSNPRVLLQLPNYIYGFALWNNVVYWTDYSGVHSITKDGSSNAILVESLHTICYSYNYSHFEQSYESYDNIAIISGNKQQPGPNPCGDDNGGCSKLCLLSAVDPRGYTCADEDVQDPPLPPPEGSCVNASYTGCCGVGQCRGLPEQSYCYCDVDCYQHGDCCSDIGQTCQSSQCLPKSPTLVIEGTVAELRSLTLHCQFSGYGLSTLTWLRQVGKEVQTMNLLIMSGRAIVNSTRSGSFCSTTLNSTLKISEVTQADDGEYICVAVYLVPSESIQIPINILAVNDCLSAPCLNSGKCTDRVAGYECVCVEGFTGIHCSETVVVEAVEIPSITRPPQSQSHSLGQPVNLTCGADGNPPPLYQWFKDGTEIPGASLPYLYINVAAPGDRGNYTCTASNEGGTATSSPALLSITDVYQYQAELDISGNLKMTVKELILKTVGTTTEAITVYSVRILSSVSRTTSLLVTVQSDADSANILSALFVWFSGVVSSGTVEPLQIVRYDGCPEEVLPLLSLSFLAAGDNFTTYLWPETEMRDPVLYQPCPNQAGSNSINTVSRYCGGSFSSGAQWSDVDFSQCSVWVADILSTATSQPEVLQVDAVSEITEVIETVLTDAAITDPVVAEQYLNIIDNIQQVNKSIVRESEGDTGVSKRILNSLGRFQDKIVLSKNVTAPKVYAQKSFALQIQDVTTASFDGETFNVDLGSFEEAIRLNTSIPEEALQTAMEVLVNVTASISLPPSLLSDLQGGEEVRRDDAVQRLSYSVFLTDALFQSPNQTARNLSIGTIIVALRLRSVTENQTLTMPINTTFRINEEVQSAQSSSCVHWEASAKFGDWSDADCTEVESREGERTCQCRRPTAHFAVLFDLNPAPPPAGVATALEVITYIGLVVSILSLLLMIVTYFCSKNLRSSLHGQIILNLCFALLGLYLFFLIAAHVTTVPGLCGLVSALLHYFILVFFAWTAAEAVYLYIKLVKVMGVDKYVRGYMWKAGLPAWIVPALIVLTSLAGYQYYTSKYYCRPTQWPFFFGLILPFVLVYLFNWIMFVVILTSVLHHTHTHAATSGDKVGKLRAIRQKVVIALTLSLVFGLGWGLGLLATSTRVIGITIGFQVIFTLFVGAQGLLMLVFHGFRSEKAREVWKQWLYFFTRRHKKAYGFRASTLDTMKQSTFSGTRKSAPVTSTASYSLGTLTHTGNSSFASDTLASHLEKSDITESSVIGKEPMTENDYEKPDLPTNQQPWTHANPPYSTLDHAPLQSAERPVTTDAAVDLEDCRPHLKARDEEPHIYMEIPNSPPDGGESVTAEMEASIM